MNTCILSMACFSWFYTTQENLPRTGITHSGLGTPTSVSKLDDANLMETFLNKGYLFPDGSRFHPFDNI